MAPAMPDHVQLTSAMAGARSRLHAPRAGGESISTATAQSTGGLGSHLQLQVDLANRMRQTAAHHADDGGVVHLSELEHLL